LFAALIGIAIAIRRKERSSWVVAVNSGWVLLVVGFFAFLVYQLSQIKFTF
jgi:hypothetical protein